jgi:hypothetical protein
VPTSMAISIASILTLLLSLTIYLMIELDDQEMFATNLEILPASSLNFSIYQNASFGISVHYPSEWQRFEDFRGSWFRNANDSVNVRLESITYQNGSLHELVAQQRKLTGNQFPGLEVIESNQTKIGNNYPAFKLVFTYPEAPSDPRRIIFKEMQVLAANGTRAFIISYFTTADAFDHYLPIVNRMIDSFRIIS